MQTVWLKKGAELHQTIKGSQKILEVLEPKVYILRFNGMTQEIFLEEYSDKFEFNCKLYGLETDFMDYVMTTYENTTQNLGILLDGKKGTGKSFTAKILANRLNLPIIVINEPIKGLQEFIAKFSCECVFFFDEFEKTFGTNKRDNDGVTSMLLSVMDGVYNTVNRQVFILTTNNTYIDNNFLGRPSRIRYHKTFGNLKIETVMEVIDDLLIDKSRTEEVINLVNSLSLSTIDTLKTIISDINIHPGVAITTIQEYLNLEYANHRYHFIGKCLRLDNPDSDTYSLANLEEEYSHKDDKRVDAHGKEYHIDLEDDYDIYDRWESMDRSIYTLKVGDAFWGGRVVKPIDTSNCLVIDRDNGMYRWFIKILNPELRPSLYGSLLTNMCSVNQGGGF